MRVGRIAAVLLGAALLGVVAWQAVRDDPAPPEQPVEPAQTAPEHEVTRADTRARRDPAEPAATIRGSVVRGREQLPERDCTVVLLRSGSVAARTRTDGSGEFAFDEVEPGVDHEVRVAVADLHPVRVTSLSLLPGETRHVGELYLGRPRVVRVTVTDEHGAPIPSALIDVYREPPGSMAQEAVGRALPPPVPVQSVHVDEKGEGEIVLAFGARHAAVAHAPGHARATLSQLEIALVDAHEERLRFVLWTPAALTGTVVDPAGAAVARATVLARPAPRGWGMHGERALSTAVWQTTTADGSGAFRLEDLPPGPLEVRCARGGGLPGGVRFVQIPDVAEVQLVLDETASIAGTARTAGGDPLPGVTVRCANEASTRTVVTAADGRFELRGLPPGELVHVTPIPPPGWLGPREAGSVLLPSGVMGGWYQRRLASGQHVEVDVTFERAAIVTGAVTVDGAPDGGAWVRALTLADGERRARSDTVRADPNGVYRLTSVTPGRVVLIAVPSVVHSDDTWSAFRELWDERYPEEESADAAAVDIPAGGTTRLDVEAALAKGYAEEMERRAALRERMENDDEGWTIRIVGNVTTEEGTPLLDAVVTAENGPASEGGGGMDFWSWKTIPVAADGTFEGTVKLYREPERVHFTATDARHGTVHEDAERIESGEVPTYRCDIVLPVIPTLRGRVVHDGQPVAGADVHAGGSLVARTDAEGRFAIPAPENGWLSIRKEGFLRASPRLANEPDDAPVVVELFAAGVLHGIVTDDSGHPVAGVRVLPVDEDDDPLDGYSDWEYSASHPTPVTGGDGRFRLTHVPTRGVYLRITSADRDALVTAPFVAGPFDQADEVDVVIRSPRRVTGRVVGPDGAPVEDARVRCVPRAAGAAEASTSTEADGSFVFDALQSGAYEIAAIPPRDSALQPAAVQLAPDQETVEISLPGAVYITGTARWQDGSPFRPALRLVALDPLPGALADRSVRFDPEDDGTFRVAALDGVRYAIKVYLLHWENSVGLTGGETVLGGTSGVVLTATRIVDGVPEEARNEGLVAGTIVTTGGDPVAGAHVIVFGGDVTRDATTASDGTFSVTGMDASRAGAKASVIVRAEGRRWLQLDDVVIGRSDVRIALQPARTISGKLLTADGAPATGWRIRTFRNGDEVHDLWRAEIAADGSFVLYGVSRGAWRLEAIVEDARGVRQAVDLGFTHGGAKNLELHLPE